jgi:PAS domain S-box-containing protein
MITELGDNTKAQKHDATDLVNHSADWVRRGWIGSPIGRIRGWIRRMLHAELPTLDAETLESRYQRLFDRVPMALYLTSPDGSILDANPAMVELLGYPDRESLLQLNAYDIFVEREDRSSQVDRIEETDLIRGYELQLRRFDGSLIWVLDYARAVRDSTGRTRFYEGSLEDITERKQARENLRKSNEKLGAVIENSPLAIITMDSGGNVGSWNPAAERIFGWSKDEILGKPVPLLVPSSDKAQFARLRKRLRQGERIEEVEVRRQRRDGTVINVSISAGPLRDADGSVIGVIGIVADISERKQAEETRQRLAEILEATPDLVGVSKVDGHGIYLNPAGRSLLGVTSDEATANRPIWEYHPEADSRKMREEVIPTAIREGTWTGEITFKTRDDREIPTSMVMIAHRTEDGEVDHFSTMARDLTRQKALEDRLRRAQTMDAIGRLAGGIAHDFNNLLTAIIGHADLLLKHLDDDEAKADVEEIRNAGHRAASLTSQLLAFSRRQVMQLQQLDLNAVIAGLGSRLKELVGEEIELVTVLDGTLGTVKADPVQLEEIIAAVVENACEAMPDRGRLTIETTLVDLTADDALRIGLPEAGYYAAVSIIDNGTGMDDETLSQMFEPFFSTKTEVKGTGLGMATVYGIVRQSSGAITVDSSPNLGTTVRVYLPALEKIKTIDDAALPGDALQDRGSGTILVAEDEPAVLALAARVLRARGYNVLEARDGVDAIRATEEHPGTVDVLLTDVVMPRVGGPELAERLKPTYPDIRIIYMSGYTDNKAVRGMMEDSSTPFLQKPFTPSDLLEITQKTMD